MSKVTLIVTDHGDPTVGIFPQTWEVPCPFQWDEADATEKEFFESGIKELYNEFSFSLVSVEYHVEK